MTRGDRRLTMFLFVLSLISTATLLTAPDALALDRGGYSMEILVDGIPLSEYAARGTRYIEAQRNREYSVRLHNGTGERVAIACSVDGLNSIDARSTSAGESRKWVLGPYQTIVLDGWQTNSNTARRFFFTTEENSYGTWLGRSKNLGVIAAAVFREKRQPVTIQRGQAREGSESKDGRLQGAMGSAPPPAEGEPAGPPPKSRGVPEKVAPARPDDLAATGIGRETSHPVREVNFDQEDAPTAVLEVRYEYRDSLVRLGVLPSDDICVDSLTRREGARGFEEPGFAPDPYRRRNR